MIRIYTNDYVPKYRIGKWLWNQQKERIEFEATNEAMIDMEERICTGGFKFHNQFNQMEEMIFRQEFQRADTTHDADVILVQDIKNLVLFFAPSEIINRDFVYFVNMRTIDRLLRTLIIYFEYFLKLVEFCLIRRDEIAGDMAQIQSDESTEVKRIFSARLSRHRLLVAREYSRIILGLGDMTPFYHITPIVNISQSIKDKRFHETFLAFATQVVWIAHHRRAYDIIDAEMCRLFRSEHFKLTRNESIKFTPAEASMLYGKNYTRINYRVQNSPLIQELANVAHEDLPILWIGERKYRGTDYRIHQLELEHIVPDSQLNLIDVSHGILGHPKKIYDTMLRLSYHAVRKQEYDENYDPYFIIRQPYLQFPHIDEEKIRKLSKRFESYYKIRSKYEPMGKKMKQKWIERDKIIQYFKSGGLLTNIEIKCQRELQTKGYGPSVEEITRKFIEQKKKLRKK